MLLSHNEISSIKSEMRTEIDFAWMVAEMILESQGLLKDEVNQTEAWRLAKGRHNLETMKNMGLIQAVKAGEGKNCKVSYSRREIKLAMKKIEKRRR